MTKNEVTNVFTGIGVEINNEQAGQFVQYFNLLVQWNKKMNLTAITDSHDVLVKHFADSIISNSVINYRSYESLIDIGTGAGFPGVPLKILYPHLRVTLVDALNKRIQFLALVIESLGLDGIEAVHGRAEDLARSEMRDSYDLCVSRAVSQLNVLCEYCMPFIKPGGCFVSYKGAKTMEELMASTNAITLLGGQLNQVTDQIYLSNEIKRGFVVIDKIAATDDKYPRRAGKPLKKPL